jgi:hypothetical protein
VLLKRILQKRTLRKIVLWNCRFDILHSINWFSFEHKRMVSDDNNGFVVIDLYSVFRNVSDVTIVKY